MSKLRAMAECLRTTDRSLTPEFREKVAQEIDRLAQIERQVRELVDRIEGGAEPALEDTECIVDELRAIIDPPDGEG